MAVASAGPYANQLHFAADRMITTPVPHHSVFTGWMPNQQRQSTEGIFFLLELVAEILVVSYWSQEIVPGVEVVRWLQDLIVS